MLSINGYYVNISGLAATDILRIKSDLTIQPKICPGYGDEECKPFILYSYPSRIAQPNIMKVPMHYGLTKFGQPSIFKDAHNIIATNMSFTGIYKLHDYQETIIAKYMAALGDKKCGGGIISVGCGKGKTVMALNIAARLNVKTLILVHKEFLATQWRDRALQFIPNVRIGYIKGKTFDVQHKDIVIGMIQSLSNSKKDSDYPLSIFREFGLLIADECHHLGAVQFSRVLHKWTIPFTLGLSATPRRADNCDAVFHAYLGTFIHKDPLPHTTFGISSSPDVLVHIYQYELNDAAYCEELYNYKRKPDTVRMESNIASCKRRTSFVITRIIPSILQDPHRKILILSSRIAHINVIHATLAEYIKTASDPACNGVDIGLYLGGMKPAQLAASTQCRIIIATYHMAEEAFDCPALNTLIMMTPKKRIEQAVGRILRQKKADRAIIPLVIDIADMFSCFYRWLGIRRKYYMANNYNISRFNIYDEGIPAELPRLPRPQVSQQCTGTYDVEGALAAATADIPDSSSDDDEFNYV